MHKDQEITGCDEAFDRRTLWSVIRNSVFVVNQSGDGAGNLIRQNHRVVLLAAPINRIEPITLIVVFDGFDDRPKVYTTG